MPNSETSIDNDPWLAYNKALRNLIIHFKNINMPDEDIMRAINIRSGKHIDRIINCVGSQCDAPPADFSGV